MATDVIPALEVKQLVVSSGGTMITSGMTKTRTGQIYKYPARLGNPGANTDVGFVKTGVDGCILTVAASTTADTWIVCVPNLHQGDIITSMGIVGQIESAANTVTVDYELKEMTPVATGCTTASVQAGTQISKSADYLIDETTAVAVPHTVDCTKALYFLITVTTAAATDVELLHLRLTITEK